MYAKIFAQIFDSSIADNWRIRIVFEDFLKLADQNGIVDMTPEAISARTRIPKRMVKEAITALEKPDPRSRSHEEEGRRIVQIDPDRGWGWRIVNYEKYRKMQNQFDRTAYMAEYMKKRRASKTPLDSVKLESNAVKLPPSASASTSASTSPLPEGECRGEGKVDFNVMLESKTTLSAMFNRKAGRPFTYAEESMLAELARDPAFTEQLSDIKAYRDQLKPQDRRYFPQSLCSLLGKWSEMLDRSHNAPATKELYPGSVPVNGF